MNKREVNINVIGECCSGKSSILHILKRTLRDHGFEVEFNGGIDFQNENEFDENFYGKEEQIIDALKDRTKITFSESQTKIHPQSRLTC